MNNLSFFLLGLVLIYIPACLSQNNDKQCFSQSLKPSYPCCKGSKVVYTDKDGDWGVENGKWCGIASDSSNESSDTCFAIALGYKCCKTCKVYYTDKDGDWGVENKKWCGIKDSCTAAVDNTENPVQDDNTENAVQVNNTDFEFSFLKLENNKKNMLYSPLSIEYALKMLEEGAANNTYTEINKLVGNNELSKYTNIDKILSLANGLFIRDSYFEYVKTEYINTLKEKYDAEIKKDEFKNAQNANKWIEDKTLGIIKDMIKDEIVQNPNNVMLIINALAIKMEWISQFSDNNTRGETFYLDNGKEMQATMMSQKEISNENVAYYKDDNITAVTMDLEDYDGTQLEFMAIMPNENLSDYIKNVSKEQISQIDKNLKLSSDVMDGVTLRIPKFKFNYDLKLKQDLMSLGMKDAFTEGRADFTKMADPKDSSKKLHVTEALHKADIEFTEKGVKAAAVTVFVMGTRSAPRPIETHPVVIVINKPFMFLIRDKKTNDIWFTGTVYEPNSWEKDKEEYTPSSVF